jgi:hypothetical protein
VEVLDTSQWGLVFAAPIGMDMGVSYPAFDLSGFFYMAGEDNTTVTQPNGVVKVFLMQVRDGGFV